MNEIFKKYCELKNIEHKYGFVKKDNNGKLFVETLNNDKITSLAWQKEPRKGFKTYENYIGYLVEISYATCGGVCEIGIPKKKCVKDGSYSPNKCAVVFLHELNMDKFIYKLNLKELKELQTKLKEYGK